jgi:hypothetical protein
LWLLASLQLLELLRPGPSTADATLKVLFYGGANAGDWPAVGCFRVVFATWLKRKVPPVLAAGVCASRVA